MFISILSHKKQKYDIFNNRLLHDQNKKIDNTQINTANYRKFSLKWFIGACIIGSTSCILMGIALFYAINMHKQVANLYEFLQLNNKSEENYHPDKDKKTRIVPTRTRKISGNAQRIELSTLQKINAKAVLQSQTFEFIEMILAENYNQNFEYPEFNPINLFENANIISESSDKSFYGSKIETEIKLKSLYFPINTGMIFGDNNAISSNQAEQHIKIKQLGYDKKSLKNFALAFADHHLDQKHTLTLSTTDVPTAKIIQENVSFLPKSSFKNAPEYAEDILHISTQQTILNILQNAGYHGEDVQHISHILTIIECEEDKKQDIQTYGKDVLRLGIRNTPSGQDIIVRASLYKNGTHRVSIALNDHNQYVQCAEPETSYTIQAALDGEDIQVSHFSAERLPTLYSAIFQAILAHNMPQNTAEQLIRILSNDIDMQLHVSPYDYLRVFYPLEHDKEKMKREILYIDIRFGDIKRRYYRFQSNDGRIDYYTPEGKSSKKFLLRKPVPNGIFRSPFGHRRHPILGYTKMHSGVDWSAPRGSPIVAAGDGTIIRAEWYRGYGNQIVISHANGYTSSYSHQSSFAKGIQNGMTIKQGQIIGYVGSTGLSTGPHCHFEVEVNGVKVDPMHVHLPDDKSLKGKELEDFKRDRDKVDSIIKNNFLPTKIALK